MRARVVLWHPHMQRTDNDDTDPENISLIEEFEYFDDAELPEQLHGIDDHPLPPPYHLPRRLRAEHKPPRPRRENRAAGRSARSARIVAFYAMALGLVACITTVAGAVGYITHARPRLALDETPNVRSTTRSPSPSLPQEDQIAPVTRAEPEVPPPPPAPVIEPTAPVRIDPPRRERNRPSRPAPREEEAVPVLPLPEPLPEESPGCGPLAGVDGDVHARACARPDDPTTIRAAIDAGERLAARACVRHRILRRAEWVLRLNALTAPLGAADERRLRDAVERERAACEQESAMENNVETNR